MQTDLNVANAAGATVRADINNHLEALATLSAGSTAPSVTFPNQWWFDTANNLLKQRDNANTAWITVAAKDASGWRPYFNGAQIDTVFAPLAGATFAGDVTIQSTDAGAGSGPNLTLDRNSASPAASDVLGIITFQGRDSAGNTHPYVRLLPMITDPTNGSEAGAWRFDTSVAGSGGGRMTLEAGLYMAGATGDDKGAGKINATGLYDDGVQIYPSETLVLQDRKVSGTGGGTAVATTWTARTLNANLHNTIAGASLASNQVTLPAGTYLVRASSPVGNASCNHKCRLRDVTNNATLAIGSSEQNSSASSQITQSVLVGKFTLAGTAAVELQYYSSSGSAVLGAAVSSGEAEVYAQMEIVRVS